MNTHNYDRYAAPKAAKLTAVPTSLAEIMAPYLPSKIAPQSATSGDGATTRAEPSARVPGDDDEELRLHCYCCPACGETWESAWSSACADRCPTCGTPDVEPYYSAATAELTREEETEQDAALRALRRRRGAEWRRRVGIG